MAGNKTFADSNPLNYFLIFLILNKKKIRNNINFSSEKTHYKPFLKTIIYREVFRKFFQIINLNFFF